MVWSGRRARSAHHPTADLNTNRDTSASNEKSTRRAKAGAVVSGIFAGIDAATTKHVVTRLIPGEGPRPAEAMNTATVVAKVAKWVKAGVAVHGIDEAGPMGVAQDRPRAQAGAPCRVVRPKRLEWPALASSAARTRAAEGGSFLRLRRAPSRRTTLVAGSLSLFRLVGDVYDLKELDGPRGRPGGFRISGRDFHQHDVASPSAGRRLA